MIARVPPTPAPRNPEDVPAPVTQGSELGYCRQRLIPVTDSVCLACWCQADPESTARREALQLRGRCVTMHCVADYGTVPAALLEQAVADDSPTILLRAAGVIPALYDHLRIWLQAQALTVDANRGAQYHAWSAQLAEAQLSIGQQRCPCASHVTFVAPGAPEHLYLWLQLQLREGDQVGLLRPHQGYCWTYQGTFRDGDRPWVHTLVHLLHPDSRRPRQYLIPVSPDFVPGQVLDLPPAHP